MDIVGQSRTVYTSMEVGRRWGGGGGGVKGEK